MFFFLFLDSNQRGLIIVNIDLCIILIVCFFFCFFCVVVSSSFFYILNEIDIEAAP
jgi:hypothetical protein